MHLTRQLLETEMNTVITLGEMGNRGARASMGAGVCMCVSERVNFHFKYSLFLSDALSLLLARFSYVYIFFSLSLASFLGAYECKCM